MGSVVNSVTSFLGGGSTTPAATKINSQPFNLDKEAKPYQDFAEQQREAATLRSAEATQNQNTLVQQLQAQAAGTAPSLAEAQLKSASDRSLAQQLAAAASMRGGNAASQQRNLMRAQQQTGRNLAQDSATARIQEQQSAQQQLGSITGQQQQLADQLTLQYMNSGYDYATATKKAQQQQALAQAGYDAQAAQAAAANSSAMGGALLGTIGTIGGAMIGGPAGAAVGGQLASQVAKKDGFGSAGGGDGFGDAVPANKGGRILGPEITKKDSPKNDLVKALLSGGEIVLPKSIAKGKDAPEKAKKFVQALMEKEAAKKSKKV